MNFQDQGIIISVKKYSENSAIVKIFSQNHGICKAFVKQIYSKKNQLIFQVGNFISFEWRARNHEALGSYYYCDLIKSFAAKIIFDKLKLNCFSVILSIIDNCFLERENHEILFNKFYDFLQKLTDENSSKDIFLIDYIKLELEILKSLGYGIDLSSCVVTNSQEDLIFVSPKSAQAVSRLAGEPYKDKLLKLPSFLLFDDIANDCDLKTSISEGLQLSGYFLEKFIFSQHDLSFPSRKNISGILLSKQIE